MVTGPQYIFSQQMSIRITGLRDEDNYLRLDSCFKTILCMYLSMSVTYSHHFQKPHMQFHFLHVSPTCLIRVLRAIFIISIFSILFKAYPVKPFEMCPGCMCTLSVSL